MGTKETQHLLGVLYPTSLTSCLKRVMYKVKLELNRFSSKTQQQEFSFFKLLEIYFYPGSSQRKHFSVCVSLMRTPGGCIAEDHTLKAVPKSQPLKHNGEQALTPVVHWQVRLACTVIQLIDPATIHGLGTSYWGASKSTSHPRTMNPTWSQKG